MVKTRAQRKREQEHAGVEDTFITIEESHEELPFEHRINIPRWKVLSDFSCPPKYVKYLESVLKPDMKVKATKDCWPLKAGDVGTFTRLFEPYDSLCWCKWRIDSQEKERWIFLDYLEIIEI